MKPLRATYLLIHRPWTSGIHILLTMRCLYSWRHRSPYFKFDVFVTKIEKIEVRPSCSQPKNWPLTSRKPRLRRFPRASKRRTRALLRTKHRVLQGEGQSSMHAETRKLTEGPLVIQCSQEIRKTDKWRPSLDYEIEEPAPIEYWRFAWTERRSWRRLWNVCRVEQYYGMEKPNGEKERTRRGTPEPTSGLCRLWHCEQDPAATSGYKNDFHKWNS